jgi:hypothetical protein
VGKVLLAGTKKSPFLKGDLGGFLGHNTFLKNSKRERNYYGVKSPCFPL